MPLTGRNSAALDRLSEEQGQEGRALAHADQRAAGIHTAGMNWSSSSVLTLERLPDERRFIACPEDCLHDYEGFISYLLCVMNEIIIHTQGGSHSEINNLILDLNRPDANMKTLPNAKLYSLRIFIIIFIGIHVPFVDLMSD